MNYLDFILIVIIALFTVRGIFRGLISELIVLTSLILGFVIAFSFLTPGTQFLLNLFPLIPDFAARIITFIVIFLTINISIRLLGKILNKFASFTFLQPVNRMAGGFFAFGKITLIISIVFLLFDFIPFSAHILERIEADNSVSYPYIKAFGPAVYNMLTALLPNSDQLGDQFMNTVQQVDSTAKQLILPK